MLLRCFALAVCGACLASALQPTMDVSSKDFKMKDDPNLAPFAWKPLPTGSVTPKGWLLKQLRLQAEGLSGHLSQFWADIMDSVWIGGSADGSLHERTPYWLNGVVPLAYLLANAGEDVMPAARGIYKVKQAASAEAGSLCTPNVDMMYSDITSGPAASIQECHDRCVGTAECYGFVVDNCTKPMTCWLKSTNGATTSASCRCYGKVTPKPPPPVNITEQVHKYMEYILGQQAPSGWLGPADNPKDGNTYWGRSNVILAMAMYAEAEPGRRDNVTAAMRGYLLELNRRLKSPDYAGLTGWAAQRWQDIALGAQWVLENAAAGHEAELLALLATLHGQGVDWEGWFETFNTDAGPHNVNNAQGLKSAAVWYRSSRNATLHTLSQRRMAHLDERVGLPTGMFNGDELMPNPPTRNPSRGIELCGVVEAMYSYNLMFAVHGDVSFADRAELIAFNALPATWASPTGGDMWAHQYLQAINEINAIKADPHVWTHDGDMAETYGLEPNYGCCTANFNQGWPKFANMVVYSTSDGGAAVGLLVPATARLPSGATVDIDTAYPYEDEVRITCTSKTAMPLYIRVPGWAGKATINGAAAANGTMVKMSCPVGQTMFTLKMAPEIQMKDWATPGDPTPGAWSVHRGALLYSLPIAANYTVYGHHFGDATQSNDYYLNPTQPWAYALQADPADPAKSMAFTQGEYSDGAAPFNHTNWPVHITASLRPFKSWATNVNSAASPPASPVCSGSSAGCGPAVQMQLVPHGGTELRMGEMPLA